MKPERRHRPPVRGKKSRPNPGYHPKSPQKNRWCPWQRPRQSPCSRLPRPVPLYAKPEWSRRPPVRGKKSRLNPSYRRKSPRRNRTCLWQRFRRSHCTRLRRPARLFVRSERRRNPPGEEIKQSWSKAPNILSAYLSRYKQGSCGCLRWINTCGF